MSQEYPTKWTLFHRVDDVGSNDVAVAELLESLAAHHERVVVAVIPLQLTRGMSAFLRRHSFSVFQHGVTHLNHASEGFPDEFPATLVRTNVESMLLDGRRRLEDSLGFASLGYVPPWNYTSEPTLRVLHDLGFLVLSGHARFTFHTAMDQLHVMLDTASSYEPLRTRDAASVVEEYQHLSRLSGRAPIGIMYHATRLPRRGVRNLITTAFELERIANGRSHFCQA